MRALLLIDHGSRAAEANQLSQRFGKTLGQKSGIPVYVAHMELAAPTIADQFMAARSDGCTHVDVLPLFFAPGKHLRTDIPALLSAASAATGLPYTLGSAMLEDPDFLIYCLGRLQRSEPH